MADLLPLGATVQGQQNFTWQSFSVGETVNINLTCLDPSSGGPLNLSNSAVIWTMADRFSGAVKISRQATITNASQGLCTVPIASGDTVVSGVPLSFGTYNVDCWAEDTSGNRLDLASGTIFLGPAWRLPNAPVTPLPSQSPLAQGLSWLGPYNPATAYVPSNAVSFTLAGATSSYICILPTTGNDPTNGTYWQLLAGTFGQYTPATPSQWASPAPTTEQGAIDRLAAVIYYYLLDGAAIPTSTTYSWANPQPAAPQNEIDRLAAVVYVNLLDSTPIP